MSYGQYVVPFIHFDRLNEIALRVLEVNIDTKNAFSVTHPIQLNI